MKGFLFGAAMLTVLQVALKPNSASKLTAGTGSVTSWLHKFMSASTPGIPNIAPGEPAGPKTIAPGPSTGVPVPPASAPATTPPQIFV